MKIVKIDVGLDFSEKPFGRYPEDGKYSGERFRKEFLLPALRENDRVEVVLDNVKVPYGSSFLDEAFGGLIRDEGVSKEDFEKKILIITADNYNLEEIKYSVDEASEQK